jgi:hypothetical protein
MKHLRQFEKYTNTRKKEQIIKESVLQVNDIYKVRTFIDIPQSLVNSYVKKVKDTAGKNLRQFFGDVDIAEEIVKFINTNYLNVDKIPAGALMGDAQSQPQSTSDEPSSEDTQTQAQSQPQTQPQEQPQAQVQSQPQAQTSTQEQPQVQVQTEAQPKGEFEEVKGEEAQKKPEGTEEKPEEGTEEKPEEGTEELPG